MLKSEPNKKRKKKTSECVYNDKSFSETTHLLTLMNFQLLAIAYGLL